MTAGKPTSLDQSQEVHCRQRGILQSPMASAGLFSGFDDPLPCADGWFCWPLGPQTPATPKGSLPGLRALPRIEDHARIKPG